MKDAFKRADVTSNSPSGMAPNYVGSIRRHAGGVRFVATFKEFPPRSFPPSFVPTTVMEQTIDEHEEQGLCHRPSAHSNG